MALTTGLYEVASALLACVLDELGSDAPPRACVYPGFDPADDVCCPGQVSVIVEGTFPTTSFPEPVVVADPCDASYLGVRLLVRVTRCVGSGEAKEPPSCEELDAATRQVLSDMEATARAARCCFDGDEVIAIQDGQRTFGPLGGCTGHETRLRVGIDNDCGCAD